MIADSGQLSLGVGANWGWGDLEDRSELLTLLSNERIPYLVGYSRATRNMCGPQVSVVVGHVGVPGLYEG